MNKSLKAAFLCNLLLLGFGAAGSAVAETNPIFGHAIVQKTSVAENKAIVGKGSLADYYGYYGNYYNSLAGQYGSIGYNYKSFDYYYAAYTNSTAAMNYYYAAYYNQYYGL